MEWREFDLLDRHYKRLARCLEPCKLLRYLSHVGVLDGDDVESIKPLNGERPKRETQVQILLDILKRREYGLKYFIHALLRSKTQDYLARELLKDEHFTENEVTTFIKETESELDEAQTLKLTLLEEHKPKHDNTKQEVFDVRSSRSSMILSDSGCEPDEKVDHDDDSEVVERVSSGLAQQKDSWPSFTSVADERGESETSRSRPLNRSAPILANDKLLDQEFQTGATQGFELEKWPSESEYEMYAEDSGEEHERERMKELTDKVAKLEQELVRERTFRERSEKEVEILNLEKEELYEELDQTRYELHASQQDLRFDEEDELHFEEEDELEYEMSTTETQAKHGPDGCPRQAANDAQQISNKFWRFSGSPSSEDSSECAVTQASSSSPSDCRTFSASKEYYSISDLRLSNLLQEQSGRMKSGSSSWVNLNVQHYELDDYNSELEVEQEKTPLSFLETLRKLRLRTNSLYKDAISEGKDLRMLRDRVSRGYAPPAPGNVRSNRRRNSVWFF